MRLCSDIQLAGSFQHDVRGAEVGSRIILCFLWFMIVLGLVVVVPGVNAGGYGQMPPLDESLIGMKEQGVWYFLCDAPIFFYRIPPHYATFGPPPPPCVDFSGPGCVPPRNPGVR